MFESYGVELDRKKWERINWRSRASISTNFLEELSGQRIERDVVRSSQCVSRYLERVEWNPGSARCGGLPQRRETVR